MIDVEGEVGCGVLDGTDAETDNGKNDTVQKVGESVPGERVCMLNAVKAEASKRVILALLLPLLVGPLSLLFGVAIAVVVVGSTADCPSIHGGEGG